MSTNITKNHQQCASNAYSVLGTRYVSATLFLFNKFFLKFLVIKFLFVFRKTKSFLWQQYFLKKSKCRAKPSAILSYLYKAFQSWRIYFSPFYTKENCLLRSLNCYLVSFSTNSLALQLLCGTHFTVDNSQGIPLGSVLHITEKKTAMWNDLSSVSLGYTNISREGNWYSGTSNF